MTVVEMKLKREIAGKNRDRRSWASSWACAWMVVGAPADMVVGLTVILMDEGVDARFEVDKVDGLRDMHRGTLERCDCCYC